MVPQCTGVGYVVTEMGYETVQMTECTFSSAITNSTFHWMIRMAQHGSLRLFLWNPTEREWKIFELPADDCDKYSNSYCEMNKEQICSCFKGFKPVDQHAWDLKNATRGCERKTRLSCNQDDVYLNLTNMKMPDTRNTIVDAEIGLEECKTRCLDDCNCTAVANMGTYKPSGGVMWTGELVDIRSMDQGQDLYVKLVSTDLGLFTSMNIRTDMEKLKRGSRTQPNIVFSFFLSCWFTSREEEHE